MTDRIRDHVRLGRTGFALLATVATALPVFAAPPTTRPAPAPTVPTARPAQPAPAVPDRTAAVAGSKASPEIKFDQIGLTDAMDFFRDATGANIVVDWKALQDVGLSKDTPVSLRLRNVKIGVALKKTLDAAGPGLLTYYVDENIIHVTTHAIADDRMITRVYAVEDLLTDVPDFSDVPQFQLSSSSGSRTGGAGGSSGGSSSSSGSSMFGSQSGSSGGGGGANGTTRKNQSERADELIDLITTTIRPEVWAANGGKAAIRYTTGKLVVTAPQDVHDAIGGK